MRDVVYEGGNQDDREALRLVEEVRERYRSERREPPSPKRLRP